MQDTPVVLVMFDRPAEFQRVWQAVRSVRPPVLVAISDAGRNSEEARLVASVRAIARPDWDCEFIQIYRETNLGCRKNIVDGMTRVFDQYAQAIVLEDDCVPHPDFFRFCLDLLQKYKDDGRIFSITGCNQFADRLPASDADFGFSRYFCSWGWASWRRMWKQCQWHDLPRHSSPEVWPAAPVFESTKVYWDRILSNESKMQQLDSWAFQACVSGLRTDQLTIFPRVNLVNNIGLGSGVHFSNKFIPWRIPETRGIPLQLSQPPNQDVDTIYDAYFERRHFEPRKWRKLIDRLWEAVAQR